MNVSRDYCYYHWSINEQKRADETERRRVGAVVPLCYTSLCELLEVRAPGFQGQLSGDTGCELMLMKAARPCKQHGRMSLEYITIHNCLPGAGGFHMAQPWSLPSTHTSLYTRIHILWLFHPTWIPPQVKKTTRQDTQLFVQNVFCLVLQRSKTFLSFLKLTIL